MFFLIYFFNMFGFRSLMKVSKTHDSKALFKSSKVLNHSRSIRSRVKNSWTVILLLQHVSRGGGHLQRSPPSLSSNVHGLVLTLSLQFKSANSYKHNWPKKFKQPKQTNKIERKTLNKNTQFSSHIFFYLPKELLVFFLLKLGKNKGNNNGIYKIREEDKGMKGFKKCLDKKEGGRSSL